MQGILHVHSENSFKECPLLIGDIIKSAKEKGYGAVALTDHGSMTGTAEFINTAAKEGVKPVPGVELDIRKDNKVFRLVLMAKDYTGYVGLCKAVSEANRTLVDGMPVLGYEKLAGFFGAGTPYHGHVAASGGGMDGELATAACQRLLRSREQAAESARLNEIGDAEGNLERLEMDSMQASSRLKTLEKKKKELDLRTGKNFSKKVERLRKLSGDEYRQAYTALEEEKKDCAAAQKELDRVKRKITALKKTVNGYEEENARLKQLVTEKKRLKNRDMEPPLSDEFLIHDVSSRALRYQEIFGKGDFYIELMSHGRMEEAEALPILANASLLSGVPAFLSNDVHILESGDDDVLRWQLIRSMDGNQWKEMDPSAPFYCMKDENALVDMFTGLIPDGVIKDALASMHGFFDSCSFCWPDEKHYPKYTDTEGHPSEQALEERARGNIKKLFRDGEWTEAHEERLQYELPVIQKTGYSDYTLILSEILTEGRKGRHEDLPGSFIGPGRGSGAGSLVNYLMGITRIDPLKYGLIFERYLNIERVSPPDIDSDIATSVRDLLVRYIVQRYSTKEGCIGVCGIITKMRLTAKAAVRAAGRILSSKLYGNAAKLYTVADRISKAIPNELHMTLDKCMGMLLEEFHDDTELEIIHYAKLIEGILSSYGTHAAGVIITDSGDVTDYAPIRNMGTNEEPVWNIQFDKEESEGIGLLKLDALGLTSLDVITNTLQRIYKTTGKWIDIDRIPFEKKVFREIYSKGKTNGVFQCESPGMKRLWMELKPDCIEDIIAGVALYRPGPMDFIPDYIEGKKNPGKVRYLTPELKPILEGTYGCIVYQEQVMRIVRDLAGYSMGRSDLVRRAMAKKKEAIMNAERRNFVYGNEAEGIPGCAARGIAPETAEKIYGLMVDFAKYAFNKSHAAAYAIVSYQTAWLKYHYPKEFLIESLNQAPASNIPMFIDECRRYGFEVLPPDINRSVEGFTEYDGKILFGLGSVKGVKGNSRAVIEKRGTGFKNFGEYILSGAGKSVTRTLIKAGAFQTFSPSRTGLLEIADQLADKAGRVHTLEARAEEKRKKLEAGPNSKMAERLTLGIRSNMEESRKLREEILSLPLPCRPDESTEILQMERETLFTYISAHPLDQYSDIRSDPVSALEGLEFPCPMRVCGEVSGVREFQTKAGKRMCIFDISDRTGKAKAVCWPEAYAKFGDVLKDGNVVLMDADAKKDRQEGWSLFPRYITLPESRMKQTVLEVRDHAEWERILQSEIPKYEIKQGSRLLVLTLVDKKIKVTDHYVSSDILNSGLRCAPVWKHLVISTEKGGSAGR